MILRRVTDFILRSRQQAMLAAFILAFIPLIGSFSILIAAFVTLRKSILDGLLVLIAATLPNVIAYFSYASSGGTHGIEMLALWVSIASNVLTWILACILRRYANWNFVLEISALIGIVIVVAAHGIYPDISNWWQTQLTTYLSKTETVLGPAVDAEMAAKQTTVVAAIKQYATGVIVASLMLNALLQLFIARWWQALMFNPTGFRSELYKIRLGHVAASVFVMTLVLFYAGVSVFSDIMPVLYLTFCLAGLSLFHYIAIGTRLGWLWLVIVYVAVIGMFPVGVACVAYVALLDTVLNIRERFNKSFR